MRNLDRTVLVIVVWLSVATGVRVVLAQSSSETGGQSNSPVATVDSKAGELRGGGNQTASRWTLGKNRNRSSSASSWGSASQSSSPNDAGTGNAGIGSFGSTLQADGIWRSSVPSAQFENADRPGHQAIGNENATDAQKRSPDSMDVSAGLPRSGMSMQSGIESYSSRARRLSTSDLGSGMVSPKRLTKSTGGFGYYPVGQLGARLGTSGRAGIESSGRGTRGGIGRAGVTRNSRLSGTRVHPMRERSGGRIRGGYRSQSGLHEHTGSGRYSTGIGQSGIGRNAGGRARRGGSNPSDPGSVVQSGSFGPLRSGSRTGNSLDGSQGNGSKK